MMTVSEMIAALQTMPPNAKCVIMQFNNEIVGVIPPEAGIVDKSSQNYAAPNRYNDGEEIVFI